MFTSRMIVSVFVYHICTYKVVIRCELYFKVNQHIREFARKNKKGIFISYWYYEFRKKACVFIVQNSKMYIRVTKFVTPK